MESVVVEYHALVSSLVTPPSGTVPPIAMTLPRPPLF